MSDRPGSQATVLIADDSEPTGTLSGFVDVQSMREWRKVGGRWRKVAG